MNAQKTGPSPEGDKDPSDPPVQLLHDLGLVRGDSRYVLDLDERPGSTPVFRVFRPAPIGRVI